METRRPGTAAKFELGEITVQPAVRLVTPTAGPGSVRDLLVRHEAGDFGWLPRPEIRDESWAAAQLGGVVTGAHFLYFPDVAGEGIWRYYWTLEGAGLASDDAAIIEVRTDLGQAETRVELVHDPEGYYWERCHRGDRPPGRRVVFTGR